MLDLESAIKHAEEVAQEKRYEYQECLAVHDMENAMDCGKCGEEHKQLAEWLKELKAFKARKGEWLKMSDEQEDNRYKCSRCGNVVHYKDKMNLYTFNNWCGRCGSDNGRKVEVEE